MRAPTAAWRPGSDPASSLEAGPASARASTRKFRFGATPRDDTEPALRAGVLVGDRYRVESLLGEGGMGRVYRARHVYLDRPVAIKVLRRDARTDPDSVQRFQREALAASKVGHAAIVQVSDFAKLPDGQVFLAMELLEGESLERFMERPSTLDRALAVLQQVAEGLAAAHAAGVIHRDIKPANIFLARRDEVDDALGVQAKILDFGIAKMATERVGGYTTSNGAVLGTPYYLAPERARGDEPDPRADIYSLGVILYEQLTGTLPFVADNFMAILGHHMHTPPVDPRLAAPDRAVPDEVAALCLAMLAKRPEARPASADEVARALAVIRETHGAALERVATGPRSGVASADADTQALPVGGANRAADAADTEVLRPWPADSDVRGEVGTSAPVATAPTAGGRSRRVGLVVAAAVVVGAAAGLIALELGGGAERRAPAPDGAAEHDETPVGAAPPPGRTVAAEPASAALDDPPAPSAPSVTPQPEPESEPPPSAASASPGPRAGKASAGRDTTPPARDDGTKGRRERPGGGIDHEPANPRRPDDKAAQPTPSPAPPERRVPDDGQTPPELKDDIYGD